MMNIEYMAPADLIPYSKNAKRHPSEQVKLIANSIKEFGFQQPIVVDKDNIVVIGHGRLLAEIQTSQKEILFGETVLCYMWYNRKDTDTSHNPIQVDAG